MAVVTHAPVPTYERIEVTTAQTSAPQRHSTCLDSSPITLDCVACGPSPAIRCSDGAGSDIRQFYSTYYTTTYKGRQNRTWEKPDLAPSESTKSRTAFAHRNNVFGFAEYNDDHRFSTTTHNHYPFPPKSDASTTPKITQVTGSGFTSMPPKYNVTHDGSLLHNFKTTTRETYKPPMTTTDLNIDRSRIIPSQSAYVSDSSHIITDEDQFDRFARPQPVPFNATSYKTQKISRMDEDGYTRSQHGNILSNSVTRPKPLQDNVWETTARAYHKPFALTPGICKGNGPKGAQGSVRNNPATFPIIEDPSRFRTETFDQFQSPRDPYPISPGTFPKICELKPSGFTHSNKYTFVRELDPRESESGLNAMQRCMQQVTLKGVDTEKPTRIWPSRVRGERGGCCGKGCC